MSARTELVKNVLSLWPDTFDKRRNRLRFATLERQLDELTGNDFARYNAIVDAVEQDNHALFCELVRATS